MISERQLARGFSAFWQELLPLLTPQFIRLFNEGYTSVLNDSEKSPLKPVPVGTCNEHPALVAEMAFHLARAACERGIPISDASEDPDLVATSADRAVQLVEQYEGVNESEAVRLTEPERQEALQIANNYTALYLHCGTELPRKFSPAIPGAGFLATCEADLVIGDTLFEIKTVNRNLSGKDLRQLIVYLALQAATEDRRWVNAGFFNPRRGIIAIFSVDNLLFKLSGGNSPSQVFNDLIGFVSSRDIHFDSVF